MKTTQATVNLVLNTQRKNKAGLCPVVLRIFWKGRKDRQTGVYISENQWDSKHQSVKPSHSEAGTLNLRLQELKNGVIQRRNALSAKGLDYSIDDLLSEKPVLMRDDLAGVLNAMSVEKGLSQNTVSAYGAVLNRLRSVGVEHLHDVDCDSVQGLCKRLKGRGWSDSTINLTVTCLGSLWKFGESKGLCEGYLFEKFSFWKKYRIAEKKRSVSEHDMGLILSDFLNRCVMVDALAGEWRYCAWVEAELLNRNSELFAQCCFLLSYYMQGLAFADLVRLRSEDISVVCKGDGKEYYRVKGFQRKKTNVAIDEIVVEVTDDVMPLFHCYLETMGERQGYFLPVMQNSKGAYCYDTEKKVSEAIGSCSAVVNRNLRKMFDRLGLDSEGISFYSARHSFATHYIMHGGNPVYLAEMMGRSVNGIFRYVAGLTSVEKVIEERKKVFK